MSFDNPTWGEDTISAELDLKLGIKHSTSTIRKYMVRRPSPRHRQTWKTFLKNQGHEIFACDFMTQHTAFFAVIYVFVVMELDTRRIVHVNVSTQPSLPWVKMRSTTSSSSTPAMFGVWPGSSSNTTTGRALRRGGSGASEYMRYPTPIRSCSRGRRPRMTSFDADLLSTEYGAQWHSGTVYRRK